MKLSYKARMTIIAAIGGIFIVFGIIQAVFKPNIDKNLVEQTSFILMMIALMLFLSRGKKKNASEKEEDKKTEGNDGDHEDSK